MMERENLLLEIPYGTRDFLPGEAAKKRVLENRLADLFASWGYEEVSTPVMEYLDTLLMGSGSEAEERMFKFFGRDNRTLALRHEMTTPIARLATGRLRGAKLPLKLSYISSVYRYEQTQAGRQCEFYQAGVELLGSESAAADAEIIALAIESLRSAGVTDFRLCLGHVGFAHGLTEEFGLSVRQKAKIKQAIESKNLVCLQNLVENAGISAAKCQILNEIPRLYGDVEVLHRAEQMADNTMSRAALDNLAQIYKLLKNYELEQYVAFDLGMIRDFGYYTGMVFEIYVPTLGFPLCGGGRYDTMLADFGQDCAATGFALGIERVMMALRGAETEALKPVKNVFVSFAAGHIAEAIAEARRLRGEGYVAELSLVPQTLAEADNYREQNGYEQLAYFG